jgi:REP element-mobilizing transposase RayT
MKDWQSQAHVKWDCKYHVVILPKYRRKVLYGRIRRGIGQILRDLCGQEDIELVEGKAMPDHIHMLLSVPTNSDSPHPSIVPHRTVHASYGSPVPGSDLVPHASVRANHGS